MYIELKNVSKKIKGIDILDDVSLRMESGKIYGFRGKNGSGKTMLMRAIAGLIKVTGTVDINGKILGKDEMFPPSIGILIENPSFISNYTGFENLKTLASIRERIDDNKIRQTLTEVGLEPDDKRTFKKYSLGMKQRLGIAAAIMEDPDIIILDEPTAALDSYYTEEVKNIIVKESKEHLFIISTHDPVLFDIADTLYQIENKKIICLKHNEMKKEIEDKRLNQTVNIPMFFFKMKKHKLVNNILMLLILSISIVVTSLSAGYSLSDKNSHYDQVDSMVNKEVIVYKPIMLQHPYYFSGDAQESIISNDELDEINKIDGIKSLNDYIEINLLTSKRKEKIWRYCVQKI